MLTMDQDIEHLVRRFYDEIWNSKQFGVAEEVLRPDLSFRGSLGDELVGIRGFLGYVEGIHGSLSDYRCEVHTLVAAENRAAARMVFSGRHTGEFLGVEPTGRQISWQGAAFFTVRNDKIGAIWVLGDLVSLEQQMGTAGRQT